MRACTLDFGRLVSAFGGHVVSYKAGASEIGRHAGRALRYSKRRTACLTFESATGPRSSPIRQLPRRPLQTADFSPLSSRGGEKPVIRRDAAKQCQTAPRFVDKRPSRLLASLDKSAKILWITSWCAAASKCRMDPLSIDRGVSIHYLRTPKSQAAWRARG